MFEDIRRALKDLLEGDVAPSDRRSALIHEEFSELGSNHGFTSDLFTTLLKLVSRLLPVQLLKGTVVVVLSPMIYGLEQNN